MEAERKRRKEIRGGGSVGGSMEEKGMCPSSQSLHPTTDNGPEAIRATSGHMRHSRSRASYEGFRNLTIVVLR
ncbi:hypothetical protein GCM10009548_40150 [Streptomyces malaysiensis subsp. malaysiensis]